MLGKTLSQQEFERLCHCLRIQPGSNHIPALRSELLVSGFSKLVKLAMDLRLEAALASALLEKQLLPPIPKFALADGRTTITKSVDDILAAHQTRRAAMTERLVEIVAVLNQAGIFPTLIKGARSLWSGAPKWRSLLDFDMVVMGDEARRAQALVQGMGYAPIKRHYIDIVKHHLPELFRPDLPGWVEIHSQISVRFAETLIPTQALVGRQDVVSLGPNAKAGILRPADHVLQGMVHHHFHHAEFRNRGWLDIKGVYEFTAEITGLNESERTELLSRASAHPRLLAALDLWLAAASNLFDCPIEPPFKLYPDAAMRWTKALRRMTGEEKGLAFYPGHAEEIALCFNRERLERTNTSKSFVGLGLGRLKVLASLANNSYPNTIALPRLWP